ncbi:hypothetical protein GCM10022251_77000 [Phytohabitans flavus]|uniref:Uncharacterized protein n=1 Tax=Phytohabitans flavus TaxID=1076124 RepID=A0A6F8XLR5_9ACTN|nr:hypothetical protein [Phytohabitans flavus]BCB74729.1 hypothetical protein Pflav_011390 [Phytohabitans flavus]
MTAPEYVEIEVPWRWWRAEQLAESLCRQAFGEVMAAAFETRATRDALALTLMLSGVTGETARPSRVVLGMIRDRLSAVASWRSWSQDALRRSPADDVDIRFAAASWQWLMRTRLLKGRCPTCSAGQREPVDALDVGVRGAREVVDALLW